MENQSHIRTCPNCNRKIIYRNVRSFRAAEDAKQVCRPCSQIKNRRAYPMSRPCPRCGKLLTYKDKTSCYKAENKKTVCGSCRSSLQMQNPETRRKRIESIKKVEHTWNHKVAATRKKNGTYVVSEEQKEKLRIINIERKIQDGTLSWPNYNRTACDLFWKLEEDLGWNGYYATKNNEKRIGRYWVDYYEPRINVVIEFDEPYHFDKCGNLKQRDIDRQRWIENRIGCNFFRINQSTSYEQLKNLLLDHLQGRTD